MTYLGEIIHRYSPTFAALASLREIFRVSVAALPRWELRGKISLAIICFIFFLTVGGVFSRALAQDSRGSLERIKIAYASIGGNMAPIWISHEAGYFRREGLSTELIFMQGGTPVVQAMLAGKFSWDIRGERRRSARV